MPIAYNNLSVVGHILILHGRGEIATFVTCAKSKMLEVSTLKKQEASQVMVELNNSCAKVKAHLYTKCGRQ
jgi:hypothetical protein